MKKVSIVTPSFNEKENIEKLIEAVRNIFFNELKNYEFEHIIIDNKSTDGTIEILKDLAKRYKELKIIINTKNFGHILSPHHARLQSTGDLIINLAADFQDPPEIIPKFIQEWENGYKVVLGIKKKESNETFLIKYLRAIFYKLIRKLSNNEFYENFSSYCLIDRVVLEKIKKINDRNPYFRGLIASIGYVPSKIYYKKNVREKGKSKNNFYTLYDLAILGITNYSKLPMRLCIFVGFFLTCISLTVGIFYFFYKIIFWDEFSTGIAPLIITISFFMSFILFFLGIIGEYLLLLLSKIITLPVIEEERINF